ncbi:relaxin-3 receptor 1-like [Scyliorhinus canicula]|uniref:relaxin-3 receptor 1-like n=1 Tax=Scyliorhinus canicula TaxID=7830 RepID=UPI0018F4C8DC|nr:relaxin-3 receptor 1-like [Scyliorhinus canicula]
MPDLNCCSHHDVFSFSLNQTNQSLEDFLKSLTFANTEGHSDGFKVTRILISIVYLIVCALGLVGNLLVLYLLQSRYAKKKSTMTILVMGLAVTDLQFVLTLPFWAVDTAMDFSWPFGKVMCKVVSSVTVMNMYASVFFLTAMSITRYLSVTQALKMKEHSAGYSDKLICLSIWIVAGIATLPHAIYSTTLVLTDEELCIVKFPDIHSDPQFWLGLYKLLKVLAGFILPLIIISVCYILLLRFVNRKEMSSSNPKRTSKVTKSVTIVVLSFFICWLPNQAITVWSAFIKLNMVNFTGAFYTTQAYIFPITVCLAHSNSCLNPILYCLMRREFRVALQELFLKVTPVTQIRPLLSSLAPSKKTQMPVVISTSK